MALLIEGPVNRSRRRTGARRCVFASLAPKLCRTMAALCLIMSWASHIASPGHAEEPSGEHILKSLFLYHFTKFVEWPSSALPHPQTPLSVCIIGERSFAAAEHSVRGKSSNTHPVIFQHVTASDALTECHILFVEASNITTLRMIRERLNNRPTLTVCDVDNCTEHGFMIGLRLETGKIRLTLNLDALQRTELKVSSQLIKLSTPAGNTY